MQIRIIFITGTDTGVGKTLLTGLLLAHLRSTGVRALAMKPFCSGGTADVDLLYALQDGDLTRDQINPFYFAEPIAPLVAARKHRRKIPLDAVIEHIHSVTGHLAPNFKVQGSKFKVQGSGCVSTLDSLATHQSTNSLIHSSGAPPLHLSRTPFLLIEGSGGLLVPLGEGYTVLDLIAKLDCEVIVVSRNRLGTINHTLLTVQALQTARGQRSEQKSQATAMQQLSVVLMNDSLPSRSTPATRHNPEILTELLAPIPLHPIPFLGKNCCRPQAIRNRAKKMKKSLAQIVR